MASDAALADTADARSSTGWISLCAGAAWSWAVETLLVVLSSTELSIAEQQTPAKKFWRKSSYSKRPNLTCQCSIPFCWTISQQLRWRVVLRHIIKERSTLHIATKYHYQRQLLLQGIVRFSTSSDTGANC
jgi:hypothetical protein